MGIFILLRVKNTNLFGIINIGNNITLGGVNIRQETQFHCENCHDFTSTSREETENHEKQCMAAKKAFEPVVEEFKSLLVDNGITEPTISWQGTYSSSNHGMDYHPYRFLRLQFTRGERNYDFDFTSDPVGDGRYESGYIDNAQQMLSVVLSRLENATAESLEGTLTRDGQYYDWEIGYQSLEDFLSEHTGKKVRIQVISD
jgi:hypothetical protein